MAGLDLVAATKVDYVAARDAGKAAERRGVWHVRQDTMTLAGPHEKDRVLALRRIFVHSSARAQAAHYPHQQAVADRVTAIGRARRVSDYLRAETGTDPSTGKPTLTWHFDQAGIDTEAATGGWYALLTNLPADSADAGQVLTHYKGQEAGEAGRGRKCRSRCCWCSRPSRTIPVLAGSRSAPVSPAPPGSPPRQGHEPPGSAVPAAASPDSPSRRRSRIPATATRWPAARPHRAPTHPTRTARPPGPPRRSHACRRAAGG
jgi:hypothetical protein